VTKPSPSRWVRQSADGYGALVTAITLITTLLLVGLRIPAILLGIVTFSALALAMGIDALQVSPTVRHRRWRTVQFAIVMVVMVTIGFAMIYLELGLSREDAFSERLSPVDALYLSLTTLTTTGFGDITAKSTSARLFVSLQMVLDLVVVAVVVARLLRLAERGG
jgi:voltage-gated potassium channel